MNLDTEKWDNISECYCNATQKTVQKGNLEGQCCFCGSESNQLVPFPSKKKFTLSEFIIDSNYICPYCLQMYNTQALRYSHWVLSKTEWKKVEAKNVLQTLLETSPPFVFFTSKTFKRQGWIRLLRNNYVSDPSFLIWVYENELMMMKRSDLDEILAFLSPLLQIIRQKSALISGLIDIDKIKKQIPSFSEEKWISHWTQYHELKEWKWIIAFLPFD